MIARGVLIDLEGVVYQEGDPLPGAREALRELTDRGLAVRFLTNTTTHSRRQIVTRLRAMQIEVTAAQIFTPARAAGLLLAREGVGRIHLATPSVLAEDFVGCQLVDENPDAVVMGDLHTDFTWQRLDGLFKMLLDGARLIALHRNRFCRRGARLALDLGPFVAALEYAADTEALVVGKPAEPFFAGAVDDMALARSEVVMIGDDIEADIGGALSAGLVAVQTRTGKYSARDDRHQRVSPTDRLSSIADLPRWLDEMAGRNG